MQGGAERGKKAQGGTGRRREVRGGGTGALQGSHFFSSGPAALRKWGQLSAAGSFVEKGDELQEGAQPLPRRPPAPPCPRTVTCTVADPLKC